jgi:uncharacterized protein
VALSQDLLDILCCPEDRTPVAVAPTTLVERLNAAIAAGKVKNKAGEQVKQPVESALVRRDGKVAYPVRDDTPVMLVEEGIVLEGI